MDGVFFEKELQNSQTQNDRYNSNLLEPEMQYVACYLNRYAGFGANENSLQMLGKGKAPA
jgi:hypothetical protein